MHSCMNADTSVQFVASGFRPGWPGPLQNPLGGLLQVELVTWDSGRLLCRQHPHSALLGATRNGQARYGKEREGFAPLP
jgi:hypothetical protein